jgi:hypothetical protein
MTLMSTVAGCEIAIGAAVNDVPDDADLTLAEFTTGQSYVDIANWQTMGNHGDTSTLVTEQLISRARDYKMNGTVNGGSMNNMFGIKRDDPGQIALRVAQRTKFNYRIRIRYNDAPPAVTSTVTMTIAAPGVVSWTAHGLSNGDGVKFTTTGALPTGLTAGTTYYVVSASTDAFSVAETPGGAAITTSGSQSGTHTATSVPTPTTEYFYALVQTAAEQGGGANTSLMLSSTLEINSASAFVDATGA